MTTNLSGQHRRAFEILTSQEHTSSAICGVFLSNRHAPAIVAGTTNEPANEACETEFHIQPPFVSSSTVRPWLAETVTRNERHYCVPPPP